MTAARRHFFSVPSLVMATVLTLPSPSPQLNLHLDTPTISAQVTADSPVSGLGFGRLLDSPAGVVPLRAGVSATNPPGSPRSLRVSPAKRVTLA